MNNADSHDAKNDISDINVLQIESNTLGIQLIQVYYEPSTKIIRIFTTNPEKFNEYIIEGTADISGNEYLDNRNTNLSNRKKGKIKHFNVNENIQIFNMDEINNYPMDSVFYTNLFNSEKDLLPLQTK